jgi:hypothetical protein
MRDPPNLEVLVGIGSILRLGAAACAAACLTTVAPEHAAAVTHPCWQAVGGFVVTCDPVQLARNSARKTGPPLPARLWVKVAGYKTGCILGLCGVAGDHLIPGDKIVFKGHPGPQTYVVLFTGIDPADAQILVRPRDVKMTGSSMVWTVSWDDGMQLPRIRELSPHHRSVPFQVLSRRP